MDEAAANAKAGFSKTPEGYTWHHSENLGVMELVREDVHDAVRHTGGVAIFKAGWRKFYQDMRIPVPPIYTN